MDYSVYNMTIKDWAITAFKSLGTTAIIAYLFYDSMLLLVVFPVVFMYFIRACRLEGVQRQ